MKENDTIAAIGTPHGKGGVAMIRISGDRAFEIADEVFEPFGKKQLSDIGMRYSVYGRIFSESGGVRESIDDGILVKYKAPYSFTGEDVVEICCHGGVLVTGEVLDAVLCRGARMAEAGEFTRRAFVNGKMSLTSAEALGTLLDAVTHEQVRLSGAGMRGILGESIDAEYKTLTRVMSSIFAVIDYPDEDLADMSREEISRAVSSVLERLKRLEATYKTGHAIAEGIPTVICGHTNAGKSSLYNLMVGHDAAIVTDIEGTTRDVLKETASVGGVTLRLCDTAGLRESDDTVEKIGIDRAKREMENAELIIEVFDGTDHSHVSHESIGLNNAYKIAVLNKCDITDEKTIKCFDATGYDKVIVMSALTGAGYSDLERAIKDAFTDGEIDTGKDPVIANARQHSSIVRAIDSLENAKDSIISGQMYDICSGDIELAMESLSELDGRGINEDIVKDIFSRFCVGK